MTYLVNGFDLRNVAWRIETGQGLQQTPAWQGDDLDVAGWYGSLDVHAEPGQQRRPFGPGRWGPVRMWVKGVDPQTGAMPSDPSDLARYLANVDTLARVFHARSLTIVHPRADGDRQAVGHLGGDPLDFTRQPSSPWFGQFVVDVVLPDPFWYEQLPVTAAAVLPNGGSLSMAPFAKATAPMRASELRFGPGNNPSLQHAGGFWAWDGITATGRELIAQCDPRDPVLVGGGSWPANTPAYAGIRYSPGPSWFEIDPTVPTATLTHTGGGSMSVAVSARIAHLTS